MPRRSFIVILVLTGTIAVILSISSLGFALFPSYSASIVTTGQVYPEPVIEPGRNETLEPENEQAQQKEEVDSNELVKEQEEIACAAVVNVDIETDQESYRAGDDVKVTGEFWIGPVKDKELVQISWGSPDPDNYDEIDVKPQYHDCGFTFEYTIRNVAVPGTWTVHATYPPVYGNLGTGTTFEVMMPESKITVTTGKTYYKPGDSVSVYGYADTSLEDDDGLVQLAFYDPDGRRNVFLGAQRDNDSGTFENHEFVIPEPMGEIYGPGTWKIVATYGGNQQETTFEVVEENIVIVPGPGRDDGLNNQDGVYDPEPIILPVKITGPAADECRDEVESAFTALEQVPEFYNYVTKYTETIECHFGELSSKGFADNPIIPRKTIRLSEGAYDGKTYGVHSTGGKGLGAVFVHEAVHEEQQIEHCPLQDPNPSFWYWLFGDHLRDTGACIIGAYSPHNVNTTEAEAGLYQTRAQFAMGFAGHSGSPLAFCHERVHGIYTQLLNIEPTNEVYIDYCGEIPSKKPSGENIIRIP